MSHTIECPKCSFKYDVKNIDLNIGNVFHTAISHCPACNIKNIMTLRSYYAPDCEEKNDNIRTKTGGD